MRISKVTFIFGLFIVLSAAFMGQVGRFISEKLGKPYFEILIGILFLLSAAGLILYLKRAGLGKIRLLIFMCFYSRISFCLASRHSGGEDASSIIWSFRMAGY